MGNTGFPDITSITGKYGNICTFTRERVENGAQVEQGYEQVAKI